MADNQEARKCGSRCEDIFRACLNRGEHESVCRMERVPCDCRCGMS